MQISKYLANGIRYYVVPGRKQHYPSVTSVLAVIGKPGLYDWQTKTLISSIRERLVNKPNIFQNFIVTTYYS